jgi:hypothetical protein
MYVSEESHSGILPMNHTNKDGTSSAESGEGRPLIKENARQPNTYPTQSGKGVSQGLADVRKAARDNKEMKFTALLHHLTVDLLRESFYSLKRKAAPGVDGVTWQEYEIGLEDRLVDLHAQLVIQVIQIVDLLLVGDQRSKNLAHLQQPTPVFVRAGQARDLAATHDSNFPQSYPAEDALESFPTVRRHTRTGTEITVDDLHISPTQVSYPIGHLILKALTLQVVAHLFLA